MEDSVKVEDIKVINVHSVHVIEKIVKTTQQNSCKL